MKKIIILKFSDKYSYLRDFVNYNRYYLYKKYKTLRMKNKLLILFLTISAIFFTNCCNAQSQSDSINQQVIMMLKNFYTIYITEFPKAGNENK